MRIRRLLLTLLALGVAAVLQGCGGQEGDESGTGGEPASTSVSVTADEYLFDPADVAAAADEDVDVALDNAGQLEHEWVVLTAGTAIESEAEFGEDLVAFEVEAPSGEGGAATMNLPAGQYQVICGIPGHFNAGMEGTLTLE